MNRSQQPPPAAAALPQDARAAVKAICTVARHPRAPGWPKLERLPLSLGVYKRVVSFETWVATHETQPEGGAEAAAAAEEEEEAAGPAPKRAKLSTDLCEVQPPRDRWAVLAAAVLADGRWPQPLTRLSLRCTPLCRQQVYQ